MPASLPRQQRSPLLLLTTRVCGFTAGLYVENFRALKAIPLLHITQHKEANAHTIEVRQRSSHEQSSDNHATQDSSAAVVPSRRQQEKSTGTSARQADIIKSSALTTPQRSRLILKLQQSNQKTAYLFARYRGNLPCHHITPHDTRHTRTASAPVLCSLAPASPANFFITLRTTRASFSWPSRTYFSGPGCAEAHLRYGHDILARQPTEYSASYFL